MERREEASHRAESEGLVDEDASQRRFVGEEEDAGEGNFLGENDMEESESLEEREPETGTTHEEEPESEMDFTEYLQGHVQQWERELEEAETGRGVRRTAFFRTDEDGDVARPGKKGRNVPGSGSNSSERAHVRDMSRSRHSRLGSTTLRKLENAVFEATFKRTNELRKWMERRGTTRGVHKFLPPKNAVESVQEFARGCEFVINEESADPPLFTAQVCRDECVLGEGRGSSREIAMEAAAEEAIKASVLKFLSQSPTHAEPDSSDSEEEFSEGLGLGRSRFSWNAFASFAIHKVLKEWADKGLNVPSIGFYQAMREARGKATTDRKVPFYANKLHPSSLLDYLRPKEMPFQTENAYGGKEKYITAAYRIDGVAYTGRGRNKREAGRAAAELALKHLFGVNCDE